MQRCITSPLFLKLDLRHTTLHCTQDANQGRRTNLRPPVWTCQAVAKRDVHSVFFNTSVNQLSGTFIYCNILQGILISNPVTCSGLLVVVRYIRTVTILCLNIIIYLPSSGTFTYRCQYKTRLTVFNGAIHPETSPVIINQQEKPASVDKNVQKLDGKNSKVYRRKAQTKNMTK
jgi:hypothetical protein